MVVPGADRKSEPLPSWLAVNEWPTRCVRIGITGTRDGKPAEAAPPSRLPAGLRDPADWLVLTPCAHDVSTTILGMVALRIAAAQSLPLVEGQRSLHGAPYASIAAGHPLRLEVPAGISAPCLLVLVPAVDGRERLTLRVSDADGKELTHTEVAFPTVGERLLIPLPRWSPLLDVELVGAGVLHIRREPGVAPQVLPIDRPFRTESDRVEALAAHLTGAGAGALWGWMSGCVFDALDAWAARDTRWATVLGDHLDRYLVGGHLVYENPRSQIADDRITGIESTLPFAAVARHRPGHPCLELLRRFASAEHGPHGAIIDGQTVSAEGNYTVAWPLLRLAAHDGNPALQELAWTQLRVRRDALWGSGALHLRASPGGFTYRGWSRGVAWYLLGLVRCLAEVPPVQRPPDLVQEVGRALTWAATHQRSDGLWANFLEEPELDADTSGSAGIAAMFALAAAAGLPGGDRERAQRCWMGLADRVDASGYPIGVAPNNKAQGGEDLQRQSGRSSTPFGLGLVAQLAAQLELIA